ncbi:MAG: DUF3806 domain-containing protein, partial [Gammaproteobacteria bacterium]|nr:DUF3806 domain-containing protein [Gammaproteobacteria bacterium]
YIGIRSLQGNTEDLAVIQQIIDRDILGEDQIREWQYLGVVFGDILVAEFDLNWVSYEDDLGVSKALQWRDTDNFVFPVTLFSKRIRFNEKPDAREIYDKLVTEINQFKLLPSSLVAPAGRSR